MKHPRMSHIQADDLLNHSVPREFQHPIRPCRGVALVIVLAVIVLVLGLVVAFMNLAKTERRSAATYLANTEVRQLADTAVGIVQAQINHATSQGSNTAWISQPGMVRTYNSSGGLQTAYKLYSAESLTETSAGALVGDGDAPTGDKDTSWAAKPAHWVDLNSPVKTADKSIYPIIDPDVFNASDQPLAIEIKGAPVGTVAPANPAPMPVRWLYVLQDGEVVAPTTGGNGTTATVGNATSTNPIVGRIAFWTDDESCKVNINTAGAGSFWDQPRFTNQNERDFAKKQPLNGEFQRYPGHPAMTSLRAVFPAMTDEDILSILTPRYQWGGSLQGTVDTFKLTTALAGGNVADFPLYASVDELFFRPSFTLNGTSSTSNGTSEKTRKDNSSLSVDQINTARFFLTHASRAPEINLFNLPRVSIWPISKSKDSRTTFDDVIAFASTVGGKPYYFERQNAMSPTADAAITRNIEIYEYLQGLTGESVPGFGVKMSGKFGSDRDQILTQVWDYIRSTNLFDSRLDDGNQFTENKGVEGYGYVTPLEYGSTRGFGRAVTLSELAFAFLCSVDPVDTENTPPDALGLRKSNNPPTLQPHQRKIQMAIIPELFSPSHGNIFIRLAPTTKVRISGLDSLKLNGQSLFSSSEAELILHREFGGGHHNRRMGGPFDSRAFFTIKSGTANNSAKLISLPVTIDAYTPDPVNPTTIPPREDWRMDFQSGTLTVKFEQSGQVIQTIEINPPSGSIPIPNLVTRGTDYTPSDTESAVIPETPESYWWNFTSRVGSYLRLNPGSSRVYDSNNIPHEIHPETKKHDIGAGILIRSTEKYPPTDKDFTDVVRSMVPWHGDYRLVAALKEVPSSVFTPLGDWSAGGAANALIHNLGSGRNDALDIPGSKQWRRHYMTDKRIGSASTVGDGGQFAPDFRRDASTALTDHLQSTGDFDNGLAFWPDGAFINKPDEGNTYYNPSSSVSEDARYPYFNNSQEETIASEGFFSPNRMVAGPGMFGSLPTHVKRHAGSPSSVDYVWRTLLFRNQPDHPNAVSLDEGGRPSGGFAPDHLLMDLFWMPVVEPYAISEPFSTAGKVNMNYQIEPFRYITRGTAMAAVLAAEKIAAVGSTHNDKYKQSSSATNQYRLSINIPETLKQFQTRFENTTGRLFVSPTELCDLWLVPEGSSLSSMSTFWSNYNLTGDNARERPYTTIIPRLTTKSNTFTVHFRVQSLKNPPANPGVWEEGKGTVTGDYRGSTTIERFINLEDPTLASTDFASSTNSKTLDDFYRWRTIQSSQFAP